MATRKLLMSNSIAREVLAHKYIAIAAAAFAVLTWSLSAIPTAVAQFPITIGDISVNVTPDGDVFINFDDSYVRVVDGQVSISLSELLNGLDGGFIP
jgi:hypothetical protein